MSSQDQAPHNNASKAKIAEVIEDSDCRLCKEKDETIDLLISSCRKIGQTHHKSATMKLLVATLGSVQEIPSSCI